VSFSRTTILVHTFSLKANRVFVLEVNKIRGSFALLLSVQAFSISYVKI
jgi:hypothetical protein